MKHARKLTAMMLVLAFLFLLSTSAFAVSESAGPHIYENITVNIGLSGGNKSATATISFTENNNVIPDSATTYSGTMTITYVYCPADAMRPSNYVTKTVSGSFSESANGENFSLTTNAIPSNCVMIQATCVYRATIELKNATVNYTPANLTVYLD